MALEALKNSTLEPAAPLATPPVLLNATVPQHYQAKGRRVQYRHCIMGQLYDGSWRYSNAMSIAYPAMHSFLMLAIASTYQVMSAICTAKALIALEFILCWMLRLRNQHHLVTFNVAASLYLYHYGASGHVWAFLSHLRLVYSKPWTKKFALQMSDRLPPPPFDVSQLVAIDAVDNDFILMRLALQRAGATHKCIHMVQHVSYYASVEELGGLTAADFLDGPLHKPITFTKLREFFDAPQLDWNKMEDKLMFEWYERYVDGKIATLTERPGRMECIALGKTDMVFCAPIMNCNSSSNQEVDRMMNEVMKQKPGFMVYVLVADQALMERIVGRCLARPQHFSKILVIFDWFHVGAWSLCAICQLAGKTFLNWFIDMLGLDPKGKTLKEGSFSIKKEIHWENMALSVIQGLHLWLTDAVGDLQLIKSRRRFLQQCTHPGTLSVYKHLALLMNYLEVKQAVRSRSPGRLRRLKATLLPILLVKNHYKAAEQLIYSMWQEHSIDPRLSQCLSSHETVSLTQRDGVGVGANFPVERLNLLINERSAGVSDINHTKTVPLTLNATLPVSG